MSDDFGVGEALTELERIAAQNKLTRVLKEKYKTDEAAQEAVNGVMQESKRRAPLQTLDPIEIMKAYREALGQELWESIRNNPSLPSMMAEWEMKQRQAAANILLEEIQKILPENHGISMKELCLCIGIQVG